eukprot:CAMPEP_0175061828 /NCGR_PEP_ID=MMETSP0052_2-20121109/13808_1 /TAXON_ID=51329 ORGANISM="Polytomella parva, Strain SAG 63-3" /NCGR_SAMPLE_ID=MMETSP0052_2 /ASSEMBLY_ACC=CAM_ASM_000194 /LENGTH=793 /DNA_ID=CAMNT_0016327739 /DNA_START=103 /DNA_END=2481 /DNA_ORIENTATION=-
MSHRHNHGVEDGHHAESEPDLKPVEMDPNGRYLRYDVVLGRGAFKTVYKAFDEEEGIEVAWNQVKVNDLVSSPAERERLFAEIRVLKQLKHKNIMAFYDSWLDQKNWTVNFITELFTSGTLRQYRKKHKQVDEQVMKRWAWQVLQGLVYLHGHEPPIIHRDLKCDNIFVNGTSGVVKIGDLGLVTLFRGVTAPQSVLGTPEFMAPELYEEKYDEKVDVYSFGMCLLELATMEYPYSECKNAAQIYKKVTMGIHPAGLTKVENKELREFIEVCIQHDSNQRPLARQLLKHAFFESIRAPCGASSAANASSAAIGAGPSSTNLLLAESRASSLAASSGTQGGAGSSNIVGMSNGSFMDDDRVSCSLSCAVSCGSVSDGEDLCKSVSGLTPNSHSAAISRVPSGSSTSTFASAAAAALRETVENGSIALNHSTSNIGSGGGNATNNSNLIAEQMNGTNMPYASLLPVGMQTVENAAAVAAALLHHQQQLQQLQQQQQLQLQQLQQQQQLQLQQHMQQQQRRASSPSNFYSSSSSSAAQDAGAIYASRAGTGGGNPLPPPLDGSAFIAALSPPSNATTPMHYSFVTPPHQQLMATTGNGSAGGDGVGSISNNGGTPPNGTTVMGNSMGMEHSMTNGNPMSGDALNNNNLNLLSHQMPYHVRNPSAFKSADGTGLPLTYSAVVSRNLSMASGGGNGNGSGSGSGSSNNNNNSSSSMVGNGNNVYTDMVTVNSNELDYNMMIMNNGGGGMRRSVGGQPLISSPQQQQQQQQRASPSSSPVPQSYYYPNVVHGMMDSSEV